MIVFHDFFVTFMFCFAKMPIFLCCGYVAAFHYTFYSHNQFTQSSVWYFSTFTLSCSCCCCDLKHSILWWWRQCMEKMCTESKSMLSLPWCLPHKQANDDSRLWSTQIMCVRVCLYDVCRVCFDYVALPLVLLLLLWLRLLLLIYEHWAPKTIASIEDQIHIIFNCISVNFCFICKWHDVIQLATSVLKMYFCKRINEWTNEEEKN